MKLHVQRLIADYVTDSDKIHDEMDLDIGRGFFAVDLDYADFDALPAFITDGRHYWSKNGSDPIDPFPYERGYGLARENAIRDGYAEYRPSMYSSDDAAHMVVADEPLRGCDIFND